jgi:HTH-type transcriptional regulator/antitoxin HipB
MDYPVKTPAQLGPLLAGARRNRRLTQAETGRKVGLAQYAVSQLETDPSKASFDRIFKLLAALELDLIVRDRRAVKSKPTPGW